jgi:hypothetical protein
MQHFRADAAPTAAELAEMTKDHEIGDTESSGGHHQLPHAQVSRARAQSAHDQPGNRRVRFKQSNALVFHAEQWGGWGRNMSVNAETILGARADLARVNDHGDGGQLGKAVASDPTTYSFLMRRSIRK